MAHQNRRYQLKARLLAVIALLIFGSVVLVSTIGFMRYSEDLLDQTETQTQQLIEQIALNTGNYINELSRLCMSPYYNERIMNLLASSPETSAEQLEKRRTIQNYLREVMTIPRKDILRVYIFSDEVYYSTRTSHALESGEDFETEDWYQDALQTSQTVFIPAHVEENGAYSITIFSMAQRLRGLSDSSRTLGVIRVDANYSGIQDVLDDVQLLEKSALFITDSADSVIYERSGLPDELTNAEVFHAAKAADGPARVLLGKERYIINTQPVKDTDWTIIAVNAQSSLMQNVSQARNFTIVLAFFCAGLGLLVSVLFVRSFLKPIYETVGVMQKAQSGNLSVRARDNRAVEIDYVNRSFNRAALAYRGDDGAGRHAHERKIRGRVPAKKSPQYDALYNQIRPHFLFNTLSTVSLLIKSKRYADAVSSIEDLSVLLRGMVNTDRDITFSAELKIAECYLSLQERRHDMLRYEITLDPSLADCRLPALTIQPLVENALIHGCEPRTGPSRINISVRREEEYAVITVADSGIGMDEAQVAALMQAILPQRTASAAGGNARYRPRQHRAAS